MMRLKAMEINFKPWLSGLVLCAMISSCASDSPQQENETQESTAEVEQEIKTSDASMNKTQQVFYALPSPFELASLLKNSGAKFNEDILNTKENLGKYETSRSKALNLGAYGADLSYSSIFGQTQTTMKSLGCVKKLTDDLGIGAAFDPSAMERLDANKGNDDSLQQIVSEAYLMANSYLKENDRAQISTMILAGGWVEGLYIATSLVSEDQPNEDLMLMVAEQKFALENLISLLDTYGGEEGTDEILVSFKALYALYEKLEEDENASVEIEHNTENKQTVIGGDDEITITPEQLAEITNKVKEIRDSFVL